MTVVRLGLAATAALLSLTVLGCSPATPAGPPDPTPSAGPTTLPSSPSTPRTTPDPKDAMRTKLAEALRAEDPISAGVVADETTELTVVSTRWLPGWQVVDVTSVKPPHPQRFFVGLSAAGKAQYLSGDPKAFNQMLQDARIRVGSETTAVAVGQVFLDSNRTFQHYAYRVDAVGKIEWRPDLDADEQSARSKVEQTYGSQIKAPRATPDGDGWKLTFWMVDSTDLVRHDLAVTATGAVTDQRVVVVRDIPVPYSL